MKALLLGYSRISRRRVLPGLAAAGVGEVDVASASQAREVRLPDGMRGRVYADYGEALEDSRAGLVWISTVNSDHAAWALAALKRGRHVIVDKPAFPSLEAARQALDLARSRNLLLAEATVWSYHPQVAALRAAFSQAGSEPTRILSAFSFPPLDPADFRYRRRLGGGALLDTGAYAVSPGRVFFASEPAEVFCRVTERDAEVDLSYSLLLTYPGGRSLAGHFGFNTGYHNRLELLGPQVVAEVDRIFTTPPDLAPGLRVVRANQAREVEVPPADSFTLFIQTVLRALANGDHAGLARDLLMDARTLERVGQAAQEA